MAEAPLRHFVIVGGGSAGWMAAAALSSLLGDRGPRITLVESEQIGTVGVGEATIPDIINFNHMLGIREADFMAATDATFKVGIEFRNWGLKGDQYFHPFGNLGVDMQGIDFHQFWLQDARNGSNNPVEAYSLCAEAAKADAFTHPNPDSKSVTSHIRYAYHFDATKYAAFLRRYAEARGITRVEGKVSEVGLDPTSGDIQTLTLESGQTIDGDFFFDCTGFRALLMRQTLGVDFQDWSHWLPCNAAQTVACEHAGALKPYTISTAHDAGWQWRIPTQARTGNGHIYCTDYISDEDARETLLIGLDGEPLGDPRLIRFTTGCLDQFWTKNCVGIGLSSGFLEPLESTSLYLIQMGISKFITLFPKAEIAPIVRDEYNRQMQQQFDQVRDFIILHYKATQRDDTPFWRYCRDMEVPDSLLHKMDLFKAVGRVFRYEDELFSKPSWVAVMLGQNLIPEAVDPIVQTIPSEQIRHSLHSMRSAMQKAAQTMPSHSDYLERYCQTAGANAS